MGSPSRGLDDKATAQTMMDGLRLHYNFLRPHSALGGMTPAQKAKLFSETEKIEYCEDGWHLGLETYNEAVGEIMRKGAPFIRELDDKHVETETI